MSADSMPMKERVDSPHDEVHLRFAGELDLASAPRLEALCAPVLDSTARRIVLEVDDLDFVDSSGLAVLVEVRNRLNERGGSLALRGPNEHVRKLLSMTRIDEIVEIC